MDMYTRRARLYPAFLVAFPISMLVVALTPTVPEWWARIAALLAASSCRSWAAEEINGDAL